MIKMFRHVVATAACAPGGGWGGCLFAGHSDQSCLAPYYPSSLLSRWLYVNSHQLADPRQDDSKILLIFWLLKFAPFTSNHWEYRRVSRCFFSFTLQGALNWYDIVHQLIFSIEQLNYWGPLYESGRLHLGVSYSFGRESFWGGAGGGLFMAFHELCEEKAKVGQNI